MNPRTVDSYIDAGLLMPVERSPGGHRLYEGAAVARDPGVARQGLHVEATRARADAAGPPYAAKHDRYYAALHRLEHWCAALIEVGPEADARRARVLPRLTAEPERAPDLVGLGPDGPSDEAALRDFS